MDTNHVRFTLAPRRSGRSLTGMVAGGSTWRAGPPAFPWAVTWSQAWPRRVHPVRWTTPRSLSKEKANQRRNVGCGGITHSHVVRRTTENGSLLLQEPQIERPEHENDYDVHYQPLPEPVPE